MLLLVLLFISGGQLYPQDTPDSGNLLVAPLPELLEGADGQLLTSRAEWESGRREEILDLFREHVYGRVNDGKLAVSHQLVYEDPEALNGRAILKEVLLQVSNGRDSLDIMLLIFLPSDREGAVPLFTGLNFYGNHTIHPDPAIRITESWVRNNRAFGIEGNRATEASRGMRAGRWPVEYILSRGYGLASMYYGDIDPDFHDEFKNGVHGLAEEPGTDRGPDAWGSISAWAWGLSRAMDYFEADEEIDHRRIAVMGHSRLGKTSLWAGARDERFAMVVSNNSGCGGAALSRRAHGERVSRINEVFPHWFAPRFHTYGNREAALPVDQHMLMALLAPRPLYVASAAEDDWADPRGEYLSLYHGSPVRELYGEETLEDRTQPEVDQPRRAGKLAYHIRSGRHDVTLFDWKQFLDFADLHLAGSGKENPSLPESWIRKQLRNERPRLILTPALEREIAEKLKTGDPLTTQGMALMRLQAKSLLNEEVLSRKQTGRRLLSVSREAISRLSTLALVYRIDRDPSVLHRLEKELDVLCEFIDWNPSHFLDVAEMATAVSLAVDWVGEWLDPDLEKKARQALIQKALLPALDQEADYFWIEVENNWNLVCHGGLSLAALTVFEDEPELAAAILRQAVANIPLALQPYAPDGIYPEGPSYWFYATNYLTLAISSFESALGTDFGFTRAAGVMESADFSQVLAAPSGMYYNYFDSGTRGFHSLTHFGLLAWFARRSGRGLDWSAYQAALEAELQSDQGQSRPRFFPVHYLNLSLISGTVEQSFDWPAHWSGTGNEPLLIIRDPENQAGSFFLAAKGGRAADNHGNMDAGSFIFETAGVRWSVDPGNQGYHQLEEIMGSKLWNNEQDSPRWSLLTKNNFGHSTLTVNQALHHADARVPLIAREGRSSGPSFTLDMSSVFGSGLKKAHRTFTRKSSHVLSIRDELVFSDQTRQLCWQMITRADIREEGEVVVLEQDGQKLFLRVQADAPWEIRSVPLSPPPLPYDKDIPGLKRLEIYWQRKAFASDTAEIVIELDSKK